MNATERELMAKRAKWLAAMGLPDPAGLIAPKLFEVPGMISLEQADAQMLGDLLECSGQARRAISEVLAVFPAARVTAIG
jgi:hypothetical protein